MQNFQSIVFIHKHIVFEHKHIGRFSNLHQYTKSCWEMQELIHRHTFRSIRNKMTKIIPELSFHDVLSLNSTNLLMLEGNARTKSCSMCKKKGNNLITHELLLMTSSHKPRQKTYFQRKGLLTRSSDIRDKIFEISLRLTWLNLP